MKEDFDHIATTYDSEFTNSRIGSAQRKMVYSFVQRYLSDFSGCRMLEINCGTGVDAEWFLQRGADVIATDISPEMVAVTKQRNSEIKSSVLDINQLEEHFSNTPFDLIFSNFGGLNCLNQEELKNALISIEGKLKIGGKAMLVIMPTFCWWETLYFLAKGKFNQAFRRRTKKGVDANIEGVAVKTWYYSPKRIQELSSLRVEAIHPVGSFIPPSYLESFITKRPRFFERLKRWEVRMQNSSRMAAQSDHYFIYLQR